MLVNFLLASIGVIALATAWIAACAWYDNIRYDQWTREFDRKGIQWPCEPITDVRYREIRSNRDKAV